MGPPIEFIEVPLGDIPFFCFIKSTAQLGVISKLAEGAPNLIIYVTDKDVKGYRSQDGSLGVTAHALCPGGSQFIDDNPQAAAFQLTPYPPSSLPFKSISLQFRDKDVVGDHVKGLADVQVNNIIAFPLSTDAVSLSQKTIILARHNFTLIKSCWLSRIICSMIRVP